MDSSGGTAGENTPANAEDVGSWFRKTPHAAEQLSPCTTTTESEHLQPVPATREVTRTPQNQESQLEKACSRSEDSAQPKISKQIIFKGQQLLYVDYTPLRASLVAQCWRFAGDAGSWVRKIPWKRKWQPAPVFLPEKFHARSLAGCSP